MMTQYPHLAARLFNTPLLIHPAKLDAIIHGLGPRLGLDDPPQPDAYITSTPKRQPAGYRVVNGVAVIDVFGVLAHRTRMGAGSTWVQGYDGLARQFAAALADPKASAVLFQVDSPGGEVAGAFQLADKIRAARGTKPTAAIASDMAASAAYLIASAADQLYVTRTAEAGSIGVVMRHVDLSAALAKEGVRVTNIYAGARKIDGNPYQPLPDEVRARLQAQVDHYYRLFVDAVVAHRSGRISRDAVTATEAGMFTAETAVAAGLADGIANPDQLLSQIAERSVAVSQSSRAAAQGRSHKMTVLQDPAEPTTATFSQSDVDAARADGHKAGMAEGRAAERARVAAIFALPEAEGRQALATQIAMTTDLAAESIAPILSASPVVVAAATATAQNEFAAHMNRIGNPPVGPDAPTADPQAEADALWANAFKKAPGALSGNAH